MGLAVVGSVVRPAHADDKLVCISTSEEGQQQRDAGKYGAARDSFAQCAREVCPGIVRRDCTRWLASLVELQPSVVLSAKDPDGNDLAAVRVFADGALVASNLDGKPVELDPGTHVFRFEADGFTPFERPFVVRAGEKSRVVEAELERPTPPAPTAPERPLPAAPPKPTLPPQPRKTKPASTASAPVPAGAWVLGGLALAAFGAEAYLGITGLADRASLQSRPCAQTATCSASDVSAIRTKFNLADVALGVGVVSGLLALYVYFTRGPATPDDNHAAFDVSPLAGGAAAMWRGGF
jgi:hypothetical protein